MVAKPPHKPMILSGPLHRTVRWTHLDNQQRRDAPSSAIPVPSFPEPCLSVCLLAVAMPLQRTVGVRGGGGTLGTSFMVQTRSCPPDRHSSACTTSTNTPLYIAPTLSSREVGKSVRALTWEKPSTYYFYSFPFPFIKL